MCKLSQYQTNNVKMEIIKLFKNKSVKHHMLSKPDQLRVIFGKHKIDARRYLANVHKNRFELKNFDCMLQRLAEIMQKLHGFA